MVLEMTKLKSVMAGIWWRRQWDIIRDRRDEWELEIEVIKDAIVDGGKVLEFELGSCSMEPLETGSFVSPRIGVLADLKVSLVLLSMSRQVIDVTGNDGLL